MPDPKPYTRPGTFMRRVVDPIVVRLGLGTVLVVRGRRTGKEISVPLGAPLELDGTRYLVSGRGETHWVRNLRAAGEAVLRQGRRRDAFRAVELEGAERDRIVEAYRTKLGKMGVGIFKAIPSYADHPVFRIEPAERAVGSKS